MRTAVLRVKVENEILGREDRKKVAMSVARAETEFGSWTIEGHSPRIEYLPSVLEEICAVAVEGLSRLRRGGVEVGGVLFGVRDGEAVRILAFRPTPCEHAAGPSFLLSEKDRRALENVLESGRRDRALRGLEPVGWYHSHTRSEIFLSVEVLEIFDRYFPEYGQVALVVRPEQFGPSRAGFFFREADGSVRAESSYREFTLKPRRRAGPQPVLESPAPGLPSRGGNGAPRATAPYPEERQLSGAETAPPLPPPSFALVEPRISRKWIWLLLALCLLVAGLAFAARANWFRTPEQALSLRVMDIDGQLLIEWDRTAKPIQEARSATVEILDGNEKVTVEMDGERLREGSVTYLRQSDRVDVRFRVERPGSRPAQEFIRFLGQPVRPKPSSEDVEAIRQNDDLQRQVDEMRTDLQRKAAQIRRLQQRKK